jgi:hypothetical protein
VAAPLRIRRRAPEGVAAPGDAIGGWMERLVKLVPAEILAVYLAGRSHAAAIDGAWPLVCLALLLVIRIWGTHERGRGPQWSAIAVAAISFLICVLAIDGRILTLVVNSDLASLLVLVWTTVAPLIVRGDRAS